MDFFTSSQDSKFINQSPILVFKCPKSVKMNLRFFCNILPIFFPRDGFCQKTFPFGLYLSFLFTFYFLQTEKGLFKREIKKKERQKCFLFWPYFTLLCLSWFAKKAFFIKSASNEIKYFANFAAKLQRERKLLQTL